MDSDGACEAAEHFYNLLAKGDADAYVKNMKSADGMDSLMRSQMVDLMLQFMAEEKETRGGIKGAKATEDSLQDSLAVVLLDVQYGDSTHERVSLPLIYSKSRWWIR